MFLHAVAQRSGWSLALVSGAVTLHFLTGAAVVANLPRIYRRVGVPATTATGAVLLALGVCGWSQAQAPWQLYGAALVSGSGWVALGPAAVNALIAPWFARRRPAALSMAYNGASLGGVLFSPLWVFLIAQAGFPGRAMGRTDHGDADRGAVALGIHRDPAEPGPASRWRSRRGIDKRGPGVPERVPSLRRDRAFLSLAAGMALGLVAQIGLIAHLLSALAPLLGAQTAGIAMGLATAAAIAGRTLVGWLMPAGADRRVVACAAYGVQLCGSLVLALAPGQIWAAWLGVLLFGSGIGNATSLPPLIAQTEFSREDALRVVP